MKQKLIIGILFIIASILIGLCIYDIFRPVEQSIEEPKKEELLLQRNVTNYKLVISIDIDDTIQEFIYNIDVRNKKIYQNNLIEKVMDRDAYFLLASITESVWSERFKPLSNDILNQVNSLLSEYFIANTFSTLQCHFELNETFLSNISCEENKKLLTFEFYEINEIFDFKNFEYEL